MRVLARRVHSVASAGRLRTGEQRAASMLHAACVGTVLTLLSDGEKADPRLSEATREAVASAITNDPTRVKPGGIGGAANMLRAMLDLWTNFFSARHLFEDYAAYEGRHHGTSPPS